jgi:hypothetical protein
VRFTGKSRLGFYPLPLSEAQRIRSFLQFPATPSSAIDPCVGDGDAFEAITSDADVIRCGIELDAYRAEQARQRIPNIVQGNTLEVQCPVECFGFLYLNPPYDWALGPADSRRTEQSFLSHTYRWLKRGGVLVRELSATPHVAQNNQRRKSAIDGRTTRHAGYKTSRQKRKRVEEIFGWMKTVGGMRKLRHRGLKLADWMFTLAAATSRCKTEAPDRRGGSMFSARSRTAHRC